MTSPVVILLTHKYTLFSYNSNIIRDTEYFPAAHLTIFENPISGSTALHEPCVAFLISVSSLPTLCLYSPLPLKSPLPFLISLTLLDTLFLLYKMGQGVGGWYYAGIRSQPALIPPPEMRSMP